MNKNLISDNNLTNVLKKDGVSKIYVEKSYENLSQINFKELSKKFDDESWAIRLVYNDRFGGVLIKQQPGEGNRLHFHPDADECWVIIEGEWEWYIEGKGSNYVKMGDLVVVPQGTRHKITCIGTKPGIRFAITAPDVTHIYEE